MVVDDQATYQRCRVKQWGQGAVLRDEVLGAHIRTKTQQVCRAGQLLVAEIDAKVGGFAIVPPDLDGAIVSSHYFLFDIDPAALDPSYLSWCLRSDGFQSQVTAQGSTNYAAIRPSHVLAYRIPAPPLSEQLRIAAHLGSLADRLSQVDALRREVDEQVEVLCQSIMLNDPLAAPVALSTLVELRPPDVVVTAGESYQFAGVYSFGRGVFKGELRDGLDTAYTRLTTLHAGDFVYPKLMAWEGAFGIVPNDCDGYVVSPEFPVFAIDERRVLREVLDTFFRMPSTWSLIAGASTGTNVRRRRLNPRDFLAYELPLPSMRVQQQLRAVRTRVSDMRDLRAQSKADAVRLLPAALNRALTLGASAAD